MWNLGRQQPVGPVPAAQVLSVGATTQASGVARGVQVGVGGLAAQQHAAVPPAPAVSQGPNVPLQGSGMDPAVAAYLSEVVRLSIQRYPGR
ncbi:hypothetical protein ON010_g7258 [Phytophthora cinnamomi]|nr:hypothetical protein ON010_g7258 [Phytophthora cinnamomi]